MTLPHVRLTVGCTMALVAGVAVGLGFWLVRSFLAYVLFVGLSTSGMLGTRVGRELAYVIVHTVGVEGLHTSGRPGDDPFAGWDNFPWLLISLLTMLVGVAVVSLTVRARARRAREDALDRNV